MSTRTTLSLDDDVAARIEQVRRKSKTTFKAVVNQAIREGLDHMDQPKPKRKRFETGVNPSPCFFSNLDNIGEILAIVEGDNYR